MRYNQLTEAVKSTGVVRDDRTADAAVKAVLGLISSVLDERTARSFVESLPEELGLETLRGHQAKPSRTAAGDSFGVIGNSIGVSSDAAAQIMQSVLGVTCNELPQEKRRELVQALPGDWRALIQAV